MAEVLQLPLPPHSAEAEQAVLGSLLIDGPRVWPLIAGMLTGRDFYRPDHQAIFAAIAELPATPDAVTLFAHLERQGRAEAVGGLAYLSRLARETATSANAESYARIVRERSQLRALAAAARRAEAQALERGGSAETIAAELERELAAMRGGAESRGPIGAQELARALIDDLDARRDGPCGLSTGLADLDEITGGLEAGELTIFAGRPGMGKTALLVTIAAHIAREKPVMVFSAEMPALQLGRRCAALLGDIAQSKLRQPKRLDDQDWERIAEGTSRLGERHLWIDDRQLPPLEHIRAECIRHKARHGLALAMIDYCQLVKGHGASRYEELRDVAYGAKALAKELAAPVILLAQLNRDVEKRDNKRPYLSDLRDSGAIEEAADVVGMLYCEGYYEQDFGMPNVIECAIEKHRHGERGQCLWHFAGEYSRMTALDAVGRHQYRQLLAGRA